MCLRRTRNDLYTKRTEKKLGAVEGLWVIFGLSLLTYSSVQRTGCYRVVE